MRETGRGASPPPGTRTAPADRRAPPPGGVVARWGWARIPLGANDWIRFNGSAIGRRPRAALRRNETAVLAEDDLCALAGWVAGFPIAPVVAGGGLRSGGLRKVQRLPALGCLSETGMSLSGDIPHRRCRRAKEAGIGVGAGVRPWVASGYHPVGWRIERPQTALSRPGPGR